MKFSVTLRAGSSVLPAGNADLAVSVDFGTNPHLPLFVSRVSRIVAGFVRPANQCGHNSQSASCC